MSTQILYTTTTNTESLWTHTTQVIKHLFHWRKHGLQGSVKLCFCVLLNLSKVNNNLGGHHFGAMESVRKKWISGDYFLVE